MTEHTGIVDIFPTGELEFDTVSSSAWGMSKWDPLGRKYNAEALRGLAGRVQNAEPVPPHPRSPPAVAW